MSKITNVIKSFSGYTNRLEETNTPDPSFFVKGSKNVIIDSLDSVASRKGYINLGQDDGVGGIKGRFNWRTSRGDYFVGRQHGKVLQVKYTNLLDVTTWETIHDSTGSNDYSEVLSDFEKVWDDTNKVDVLVYCAGNVKFFAWNGATGAITATTATTIVSDSAPASKGFASSGNLTVNGTTYAYTGITTNTFTGVSPTPAGEAVDSFISSEVTANTIASIPSNFTCDYIGVQKNQVYIGSGTSRVILASDGLNYKNFVTSTAPAGARELVIDDNCAGFLSSKKSMVIFGQDNSLFEIKKTLSADQLKEYWNIEKLATSPQQGVISPLAKIRVKNALMYITREKTFDTVEFIANIADEQSTPISDLVKIDFDSFDFTDATVDYWERNILISIPAESVFYMYDLQKKIWQAPITWTGATIGMCSLDSNGDLIGHDAFNNKSYILFSGKNDGSSAIESKAVFAYDNNGERFALKKLTKYVQDGYITANGVLTRTLEYDYRGGNGVRASDFEGSELKYVYDIQDSGGIGKAPLGERTLSGSSLSPSSDLRRFRYADSVPPKEYYELRTTYEMSTLNGEWRLVAHGSDVGISSTELNAITRV